MTLIPKINAKKSSTDDEIQEIKPCLASATSTSLRSSLEKHFSMTPFSLDPARAKKVSVAKLKMKICELNMAIDKAVEEKDFLKAHENKRSIQKLKVQIIEIDSDISYVSQSLNVNITPLLEKETQDKKEALEKEKLAKKESFEKIKQSKKDASKAEKERQKELLKRVKEAEKLEKEKITKAEKEKLRQEKSEERLNKKAVKDAELKIKEEGKLKKVANKKEVNGVKQVAEGGLGKFTRFQVSYNMRLAPTVRNDTKVAKKRIDDLDMPSGPDGLYLALLKTDYTPGRQARTWPYEKNVLENDHEVENSEDQGKEESDPEDVTEEINEKIILNSASVNAKVPRAKLIQFQENQRPAFWGSWTKKSKLVSGRYGIYEFISLSNLYFGLFLQASVW